MKKIFLLLFLAFVVSICQAQYVCTQQETNLRRAGAKDGEGYMPVLTDDTVSFSIAYHIVTYINDYNPWCLGAQSFKYVSQASDTVTYNNNTYRYFGWNLGNGIQTPYLREDNLTGRLFRYFPENDTEVMTCDMSLTEGDTFYLPSFQNIWYWELQQEYVVVDSVTYHNGRKTIWFPPFEDSNFFGTVDRTYPLCFIEGVGPTYGPYGLEARGGFERALGLLLCVHHNDSLVYMTDPVLGCEQYVVSVPEYSDVSMKLYPNPTGDILNVEFEGIDDPQGLLTITDLTGVVVHTQACHAPVIRLNVSHLAPGLYVVGFRNEKGVVVRKFVKM